jgi:hypothetical protein
MLRKKARLTLLLAQKAQLVRRARIERVTLAIVPVLKDDSQSVCGFCEDLDDCEESFSLID